MRIVISTWILFTVGLLALLVSCPAHASETSAPLEPSAPFACSGTCLYQLEETGHGLLLVRFDGRDSDLNVTIAVIEEPNGFVCIGTEPFRADCHPSLSLPAEPVMETWHERAIAFLAGLL